jgi:crotonobetainyl-CoA:carnitine CoA-transferase CaiB-like acyl-CoA transferase
MEVADVNESRVSVAPLHGVRIIAVEQFGAGPFGTMYLADMGAEVIKIEDPRTGGDVGRYVPPGQTGSDSLYFESFNRNKRSLSLDLKSPAGRAVFERLVTRSDVVFNNLRGDLAETMGLTFESLGNLNPRVICASLSAYRRSTARWSLPGYDALLQAETGWASLTGDPDGPPVKSGLSLVDYAAGLVAALAIMIAMFETQRTGRGRDVNTSLYEVALSLLTYHATWYLSRGIQSPRLADSAHPSIVPFQFFETADGHIAIACPKDKFFERLSDALDLPGLLQDPRFSSFEARRTHRRALVEILTGALRQRTTGAWITALRGVIPVAPVRSMEEALDDEGSHGDGLIAGYDHQALGLVRFLRAPFALAGFEPTYRPGPRLAADGRSILQQHGYTEADVSALSEQGAFGTARP